MEIWRFLHSFFSEAFFVEKQTPQIIFSIQILFRSVLIFSWKQYLQRIFSIQNGEITILNGDFSIQFFFQKCFDLKKKIYRDFFHSELRLLHSNRRFLYSFKRIIFLYSEFSILILICFLPFQIDMSCSILNGDLSSLTSEIQNIFTLETAPSILSVLLFS